MLALLGRGSSDDKSINFKANIHCFTKDAEGNNKYFTIFHCKNIYFFNHMHGI